MAYDRCPATTRVTPPRSIEVFGLQCQFTKGHDGDHCATATWSFAQGEVFWPQEATADSTSSDEGRIREAMAAVLTCCGAPMTYREVFGICVFSCVHRNHARLYVKGDQVISEDDLPVHAQEQ